MKQKLLLASVFTLLISSISLAQSLDLNWASSVGGSGLDLGYCITKDMNKNVYTTGGFENVVDFDPGSGVVNINSIGQADIFIQKLDASGNLLWVHSFGSSAYDNGQHVAVDTLGNVYVTGAFNGTIDFDPGPGVQNLTSNGNMDIFILKLDSLGAFLWAVSIGGQALDVGVAITVDDYGNSLTTGHFSDTIDFNPGSGVSNLFGKGFWDIFVLKLDASGNFVWAKSMGGSGYEFGYDITTDNLGNVYLTGNYEGTVDFNPDAGIANFTSEGNEDIFVIKLDASGNYIWTNSNGGTSLDRGNSLLLDSIGNIYIVGSFEDTVDFDPGSGVNEITSNGLYDIFIQKLDNSGNLIWVKSIGGIGYDAGFDIKKDGSGNLYLIGGFSDIVDFDPGIGTNNLVSNGLGDIFILKLDESGDFIEALGFGGASYDYGYSISIDNTNNLVATGYYSNTVDFDPGTNTSNLTSNGNYDIFVVEYMPAFISINKFNDGSANRMYPNPTNGHFIIEIENQQYTEVEIYNSLGSMVHREPIKGRLNHISLPESIPNGIYIVRLKNWQTNVSTKIVLDRNVGE